jgi:hypothetical protein
MWEGESLPTGEIGALFLVVGQLFPNLQKHILLSLRQPLWYLYYVILRHYSFYILRDSTSKLEYEIDCSRTSRMAWKNVFHFGSVVPSPAAKIGYLILATARRATVSYYECIANHCHTTLHTDR